MSNDNFGTPEKRRIMRLFWKSWGAWLAREARFLQEPGNELMQFGEPLPRFPDELCGMMCGAQNRNKVPCKQRVLYANGRCKFHGGASTGPRTRKGKAKSAKNGFKSKAKHPAKNRAGSAALRDQMAV